MRSTCCWLWRDFASGRACGSGCCSICSCAASCWPRSRLPKRATRSSVSPCCLRWEGLRSAAFSIEPRVTPELPVDVLSLAVGLETECVAGQGLVHLDIEIEADSRLTLAFVENLLEAHAPVGIHPDRDLGKQL